MSNQKIHNLDEVIPSVIMNRAVRKMDAYFGVPVVVHGASEHAGNKGPYLRAVVSEHADGEQFYFNTGASQPVTLLRYLMSNGGFPVYVTFKKDGDRVLMLPVDEPDDQDG